MADDFTIVDVNGTPIQYGASCASSQPARRRTPPNNSFMSHLSDSTFYLPVSEEPAPGTVMPRPEPPPWPADLRHHCELLTPTPAFGRKDPDTYQPPMEVSLSEPPRPHTRRAAPHAPRAGKRTPHT